MHGSDPSTVAPAHGPTSPGERSLLLDVLRGFALLGITQVNWGGRLEGTLGTLLDLFVTGTFYSAFAILFGLGFAIQALRAEERGRPFIARYAWRSLLLFAIGAAHAILIWDGDVVAGYAVLALVLLLFVKVPAPAVLGLAALALTYSMAPRRWIPDLALVHVVQPYDSAQATLQRQRRDSIGRANARLREQANAGEASYWTGVRASAAVADLPGQLWDLTRLRGLKGRSEFLALFLLGLWIGRRRLIPNAGEETRLLFTVAAIGLVLGAAGNAQTVLGAFALPEALRGWRLAWSVGNIALALCYLATIALLFTHSALARRLLAPLGLVGRMGLSNYVLQSIVMTILLYGRYLDLRPELGNGWVLQGIVNVVFLGQVLLSRWWLERFLTGPVEWAWRSATWSRLQPFRRT